MHLAHLSEREQIVAGTIAASAFGRFSSTSVRTLGGAMTKLTIEVPDDVAERVVDAAAQRGVAPEELVGQVLTEQFPPRRRLSFIGMGRSGHTDTSERAKEIVGEAFAKKTAEA